MSSLGAGGTQTPLTLMPGVMARWSGDTTRGPALRKKVSVFHSGHSWEAVDSLGLHNEEMAHYVYHHCASQVPRFSWPKGSKGVLLIYMGKGKDVKKKLTSGVREVSREGYG